MFKKSVLASISGLALLCFLVMTQSSFSPAESPESTAAAAAFKWSKTQINLGNIPQGTPAEAKFTFTNTGSTPLVIANVKGSCGCTVTSYTETPIQPGKTGQVKGTYNAAKAGAFHKTITVNANDGQEPTVLHLKGVVVAKAE